MLKKEKKQPRLTSPDTVVYKLLNKKDAVEREKKKNRRPKAAILYLKKRKVKFCTDKSKKTKMESVQCYQTMEK